MSGFEDAKISLTDAEQELFQLLLQAVEAHRLKQQQHQPQEQVTTTERTILRVAGGWVRDKLLRRTSKDIDIALNNMSGVQFAHCVNDYLSSQGMETRTIAVIQANPDQSKHLETANLRVLGFDIDCVNLRAETYTDSRIPEVRIGTAHEDAQRRDFTINALFYNINDQCIEDFCGTSLSDLTQGLIRTPISPFVTFKDDPLRVLRAIRFCSRFNFQLDPELLAAASHTEIQDALYMKVSRERVYKECEGMIYNVATSHSSSGASVPVAGAFTAVGVALAAVAAAASESTMEDGSSEVEEDSHTLGCRPALAFAIMYRMQILDAVFYLDQLLKALPLVTTAPSSVVQQASLSHMIGVEDVASSYFPSLRLLHTLASLQVNPTQVDNSTSSVMTARSLLSVFWSRIAIETIFTVNLLTSHHCGVKERDSIKDFLDPRIIDFTFTEECQWSLRRSPHTKILFYAAALIALQPLYVMEKKKEISFVSILLRDGLKMENASMKNILTMLDAAKAFIGFAFSTKGVTVDAAATILRNAKELWRDSLLLAAAFTMVSQAFNKFSFPFLTEQDNDETLSLAAMGSLQSTESHVPTTGAWFQPIRRTTSMMFVMKLFQRLEESIDFMQIDGCWNTKPLMDGAELIKSLQLPKGPLVGKVMEAQLQWQIRERSCNKEACIEYLKQLFPSS